MKKLLHIIVLIAIIFACKDFARAQSKELASGKWDGGEKYEISISPNPVEHFLTIKVNPGTKKLTEIRIFDFIGKEVAIMDLEPGIHSYTLDFSNLQPGIYFCNIYSEKGIVETRKILRTK